MQLRVGVDELGSDPSSFTSRIGTAFDDRIEVLVDRDEVAPTGLPEGSGDTKTIERYHRPLDR